MKATTRRFAIDGPAGPLECALDEPIDAAAKGLAVICHPHPLHGGTMDNKVAQTLARSFVHLGWRAVRFNFRGAGGSAGDWDEGRGEIDDALAVVAALRGAGEALSLGGFSFGGSVAACAAQRLAARGVPTSHLVLVAPAVRNFPLPIPNDLAASVPQVQLIHGEADDVVALADVLDWARPLPLPVTVVPGAGHFFHGQLTLLKNIVSGACH
jgi:alpha/beta superfamily hydrolase